MARRLKNPEIFPAASIYCMTRAGLSSTYNKIQQNTYRFVVLSGVLRELDFHGRSTFLKDLEGARECFEGGRHKATQLSHFGCLIEDGQLYPASPHPSFNSEGNLTWLCNYLDGKEFGLGEEDQFLEEISREDANLDEPVKTQAGKSLMDRGGAYSKTISSTRDLILMWISSGQQ